PERRIGRRPVQAVRQAQGRRLGGRAGRAERQDGKRHRRTREGAVTAMRHVIVTALAALLLAPAAIRAEDAKADTKPVTVPFELTTSRHRVVTVKLNGKGPYRLIFDTGAPIMLINNRIAKDSGVVDAKTKQPPLALFGALGTFTINTMELGDLKADGVGTVVMDHPTVEAISQ